MATFVTVPSPLPPNRPSALPPFQSGPLGMVLWIILGTATQTWWHGRPVWAKHQLQAPPASPSQPRPSPSSPSTRDVRPGFSLSPEQGKNALLRSPLLAPLPSPSSSESMSQHCIIVITITSIFFGCILLSWPNLMTIPALLYFHKLALHESGRDTWMGLGGTQQGSLLSILSQVGLDSLGEDLIGL